MISVGMAVIAMTSLVMVGASSAGSPPRKPVKHGVAKPKPTPSQILVNAVVVNSVPEGADLYNGCMHANAKALLWGLSGVFEKAPFIRNEFETLDAFDARRRQMESALSSQGNIIICEYLNDNDDVSFKYNADLKRFSGSFSKKLRAALDWKNAGTYRSKTRMGVAANVTSYLSIDYMVDMTDNFTGAKIACLDQSGYFDHDVKFDVPVDPAEAPMVKGMGYLVVEGAIVSPFFKRVDTTGSPTLDDPTDVTSVMLSAVIRPVRLSIVVPAGKVIWSCKLS